MAIQGPTPIIANVRNSHIVTTTSNITVDEVTIDAGGTVVVNNGITFTSPADGTFDVNGILQMGTNGTALLAGSGTFALNSGGTLGVTSTAGITSAGATGNIQTTTRTFNSGANYIYNGSSAQATGNGLPSSVNSLEVDNNTGVTLTASTTVTASTDALVLTDGILATNGNNLIVSNNNPGAVNGGSSSSYVQGALQRAIAAGENTYNFPIGSNPYTPVSFDFLSGTTGGDLTGTTTGTDHPDIGDSDLDNSLSVNRYWTFTTTQATANYDATFNWDSPGDEDGSFDFNNAIVGKYDDPNWSYPTIGNRTASSIEITGESGFSDFQVAEIACTEPDVPTIGVAETSGNTNDDGIICSGDEVTLSIATGSLGDATDWEWYTVSCGDTPAGSGTSIMVSPTTTTTYYVRGEGGCATPGTCAQVTITVNANPTASITGADEVCVGSMIDLVGSPIDDDNGVLTIWDSSDDLIATVASDGVVTGVDFGSVTITLTHTDVNGCMDSDMHMVMVNLNPTITLGADPSVCTGETSAELSYSGTSASPDEYMIDWDLSAEAQLFADVPYTSLPSSPIVLAVPGGANAGQYFGTLTVRNTITGCESTGYVISVTIISTPDITNPGPQAACDSYNLPTITGSNLTGNEAYYDDSQLNGGMPLVGPITSSMTVWIYDETNTTPVCSDEESFVVTIYNTPDIDNPGMQTACGSYTLPTITGTNLSGNEAYYDDSQANNGQVITGPITSTGVVWIYDETDTSPNCFDEEFFLVIIDPEATADAGPDQSICAGEDVELDGSFGGAAATSTWSHNGDGSFDDPSDPETTYTPGPTDILNGTVTLTLTTNDPAGSCPEAMDDVVITIDAQVTTPDAGTPQAQCNNGTFTLAANTPIVGEGEWSCVDNCSGVMFDDASDPGAEVSGIPAGVTATLRWTITNGECEQSDDVTVTNHELIEADADLDQAQCEDGSFTLSGNNPAPGTGLWTCVEECTGVSFVTATDPGTVVNGVAIGTTATLRWTITNGTCVDFDEVDVTNDELIEAAAGDDLTQCNDDSFTLEGNTPSSGSGVWTCEAGCTGVDITTPASPTSEVTGVVAGTTTVLRWTITNGECEDFDEVSLSNRIQPDANAGTDQSICFGTTATLAANTPAQGTGIWSVMSGPDTDSDQFSNINNPAAVFTPAGGDGVYVLSWTIANAPCSPDNDEVEIEVLEDVNFGTVTSGDETLCSGDDPTNITLSTPASGGTGTFSYQWYTMDGLVSCPTGSVTTGWDPIDGATAASYNPPAGLTTSTTYALFVTPTGSPDCGPGEWAAGCRQVTINNVVAGSFQANQTICSGGDPAEITVLTPASGSGTLSYVWLSGTTSCGLGLSILGGETDATYDPPSGMTTTTYYRRSTVSTLNSVECSQLSISCVTITVNDVTGGTIEDDQSICEGGDPAEITQVTASTGSGTLSYYWEASTTDCNSGFTEIPLETGTTFDPGVLTETTYYRRVTVSSLNGVDCEAISNCITVTVEPTPVAGTLARTPDMDDVCEGTDVSAVLTPGSGGNGTDELEFRTHDGVAWSGYSSYTSGTDIPTTGLTMVEIRTRRLGTICPNSGYNTVSWSVDEDPVANAGSGGNECDLTFALNATPSEGVGVWNYSGPGTASFDPNVNAPNATVTVSAYGTYTFTWTETNGVCMDSDDIMVNFYQQPVADAGMDDDACDLDYVLDATASVGEGGWTYTGPGTASFTPDENDPNATALVSVLGTYTFTWTETNGTCTDDDDVVINFYPQPVADAGTGGDECDLDFDLNAVPSIGIGAWTYDGPGMATFDPDENDPTATVTVTAYGTYTFTWTETAGSCFDADDIIVNFYQQPVANAGPGGDACDLDFDLDATPSFGTGTWTYTGPGTATFAPNENDPDATATVTMYGAYTFTWTEVNGTCMDDDAVMVDFYEQPVVSDQPDQFQCGDPDFTMTQSTPSVGTGEWTLEDGTATITDDSDPMTTVTGIPVGTSATLRWTVTNGTCSAFDEVILTNNSGPNVTNMTTGDIFCSIQEAIDDAATLDGHVIVVSAGTFNENIVVTKGISLRGANYNVACDGDRNVESVLLSTAGSASIVVTIVADGVTINGFTVTNPLGTYGIVSNGYSNTDIRHNIITDIGNNVDGSFNTYGIAIVMSTTGDIDDVNISNNCISEIRGGENTSLTGNDAKANNGSAGGIIVGFAGATNGITGLNISSNIIDNITASTNIWDEGGKGAYGVLINVGATNTGEAISPAVSSNEITGLEGLWAHGIGLEGKTPGALVTNNYVDDLTGHLGGNDANGVKVEANTGAGTVQINNNSFTNMVLGINNATASSVDGTCNWFGSASEPTVALAVSANVVYIPFLTSGTDDMPATTGFQPEAGSCGGYPSDLYVDDDSNTDDLFTPGVTGSDITGNGTAAAPFRTIQKAIDVATATGTKIWVDAGLYAENVNVNKEVEIEGAGQSLTTVVPAISNPSGSSLSSAIFYIQADNVTIHDLTADGKNDAITGVGDIDASTGIITDWNAGDGDHTNLEVYNVTVRDVYLRGIQATYNFAADNTFSIHDNTIDGVQGDPDESIGIFNYGSTGTIENNTILEASTGIYSFSSHHSTISGNDITNVTHGTGIVSNFNGEGGGINLADVISDNTITGGDYGVQVANAYLNVEITGNTINGSAVAGISVQGGAGTGEVDIHDNAATITGAAIGVDIDGGTASLYRNNIHTNGIGVQVINGGELTSATENFIRTNTGDGIHIAVSAGPVSMIHDNDLSGNGGLAINNLSGTPVAASCNWYGSDEEATVATEVSADVVFIPFLTNGMDDDDMTAGFQPVPASCTGFSADLYVDDDSNTDDVFTPGATGSDITGNGTVTAPFRTIQKAIDVAAATGAKIWVDAGLYAENVNVNKEVEIEGAGQLLTTVVPAISNPGGSSLSSAIFYIQADNITIHDLTADGKNDAITGVGDIDASTGIITDWNAGDGDHTNLEVYNVTIRDVYLRGIQATFNFAADNTFNIHDNIINGVQGDPDESVALMNWGSTGTFDNNTISNSTTGIYSFSSHHTTISDNNISNATNGTGIVSNFNGEGGGVNLADVISGNTVNLGDHGIHVANAYLNVEVTGNTVTNSTVSGILIEGGAGTGVVNIHNNTATITGAVIGVDISGGAASLHRNNIHSNGTGVRVTDGGELTFATENFIQVNGGHGILIDTDAGDVGGINDNDLSGNIGFGINNLSAQTIDATCNWYGSDVAATVANEVSGNLAFVPYLTDGEDDGMDSADGFQPLDGVCDGSMITTEAEDMMVQCDGAGNTAALNAWLADNGGAEAIDICDGFGWSNDFTALSDLCGETGSATVIFTVSDDCGNMSTTSATFTIFDNTAPTGTAPASTSSNNVCYDDVLTTFPFVPATVAMNYTDACSGSDVTANLSSTTFFGDNCGWILIYAFSVSDACGNSLMGQTITHTGSDQTAPTGTPPSPSLSNNACMDDATTTYPFNAMTAAAGYSDNCGDDVTAILTNTQVIGTDCNWGIIYTFRVEDACGNSMTGQQMLISGSDQADPVADQGATALNVTLECDDADGLTDALAAAPTFTDACDDSVPAVMQSNMSTKGVDPEACTFYNYTITRTWTGTDDCGNTSDVYTQVITVQDTESPVANEESDALDVTLECDDDSGLTAALAMAPTFADNCDPTAPTVLQSTISTKGEDAEVCTFYNYTITRTWTATDACGNTSDVYTQVITVQDTESPVANEESDDLDVTLECDDDTGLTAALALAPTFTDNCDPTAPTVLQSTISTKGEDAEVCTFYNYTITRTWTATDACGNTSDVYTQVITVQDTEAPVANEENDELDVTLECDDADGLDDALALAPTFADNCDPTAPTVLQSTISTKGEDAEVCTFYNYTITRTWTATDACGNTSDVYTQVITVQDTEAPVVTEMAGDLDDTLECDDEAGLTAALALAPTFTDNCNPTATPALLNSVSTKGEDDTECDFYTYTITRTWAATDACGNTSDVYTQVITVQDTEAPAVTDGEGELDETVECDDEAGLLAALALAPTFTDNCNPTATPALLNSVSTKGEDDTECDFYNYTITRTWTATDACGNTSDVYTQVITVQDTEAPVADQTSNGLDVVLECDDMDGMTTALAMAPTFSDNCNPTVTANFVSSMSTKGEDPAECSYYTYAITRTWTATDVCGNTSSVFTQTIWVEDMTDPSVDAPTATELECSTDIPDAATTISEFLALTGADAFDNCAAEENLSVSSNTGVLDGEECSGTITRTYSIEDPCGNITMVDHVFNVSDNTVPVIAAGELDDCYETVAEAEAAALALTMANATDNCTGELSFDVDLIVDPENPMCDSLITVTVTDECMNSSMIEYTTRISCQQVRLKVYLEGAYNSVQDTMRTTLNNDHLLPGQINTIPFVANTPPGQPYSVAPHNYNYNTGMDFGDGLGDTPYPEDVVDWVLVKVREDGIGPLDNIWTCAGWVHSDGRVTFPEACEPLVIDEDKDYHIIVQHRNHLGILSTGNLTPGMGVNINCGGAFLNWDFTVADSYKPPFRVGQKLVGGRWVMFGANGEQTNTIQVISSPDRTIWAQQQGQNGYKAGDYNMNHTVDGPDETMWKQNQNRSSGIIFY